MNQIRRQLQALFAECESLCDADPDFFDCLELSERIEAACRAGCRFGVETAEVGLVSPREGLAIVGRLLAATDNAPAGELLSIAEAARVLGCSSSGLRKLVAARRIQFSQAAKHGPIRFKRAWLEGYIAGGTIEPGAPAAVKKRPGKFGFDPSLLS